MPPFLVLLGWVGLAAMLWVGGHIVIDGLHKFGIDAPHDLLHAAMHAVQSAGGFATWLAEAGGAGLFGVALGGLIVAALHAIPRKGH
jgi:predicted DNA repair protein MutK